MIDNIVMPYRIGDHVADNLVYAEHVYVEVGVPLLQVVRVDDDGPTLLHIPISMALHRARAAGGQGGVGDGQPQVAPIRQNLSPVEFLIQRSIQLSASLKIPDTYIFKRMSIHRKIDM